MKTCGYKMKSARDKSGGEGDGIKLLLRKWVLCG